jgi:hypothetical protein
VKDVADLLVSLPRVTDEQVAAGQPLEPLSRDHDLALGERT